MTIAPKKPRKKHVVTRKDFMQVAVAVGRIATGEDAREAPKELTGRAKAGQAGGLKGGDARSASLTPEQRSEIAKKAAAKRWSS